ncbi:MAG: cytidylate kinase-like family protein [Coriobacteriales bacterium]|jgi:cytidylate kinase|nr:cytidylate kinase-like family protein [Coriobacteriales bacterium]
MPKQIITVNRQYGSGGREIGALVAKQLGYDYYDKKLIQEIAHVGDVDVDLVNASGEGLMGKLSNVFSHVGMEGKDIDSLPLPDRLFLTQRKVIRGIADQGPCVIIGHLADYFLSDRSDVLNVFVYAQWAARVKRVGERNGLNEADSIHRIKRIDKNRASFYEQYAEMKFGRATNYDLSISASTFDLEQAAQLIIEAVQLGL